MDELQKEQLQNEKGMDEVFVEVIEQEAARLEITVDYYIMEFL